MSSQFQREFLDELAELVTIGSGATTLVLSSGRKVMVSVHALPIYPPQSRVYDELPIGEND
jgi:hypothetical protein